MTDPMPPGLTRRPAGVEPEHGNEAVFPCTIAPTEALLVELESDGSVAFSMLLGTQWETECAVLSAEDVGRLIGRLQQGWVGA